MRRNGEQPPYRAPECALELQADALPQPVAEEATLVRIATLDQQDLVVDLKYTYSGDAKQICGRDPDQPKRSGSLGEPSGLGADPP